MAAPFLNRAFLRLSVGPRRDWRGSVARLLPDGLTTSHLKYSILWYSVLYWMS